MIFNKNKKAISGLETILILITLVIGAIGAFMIFESFANAADNYIEGGELCLLTLKLQDMSSGSGSAGVVTGSAKLFSNRCTTKFSEIEIKKDNVAKPREEKQKKDAVMKAIADRLAYIWWMTGAGTIDSIWMEGSVITNWWGQGDTPIKCLRYMNFEILDSEYLPEVMPTKEELLTYMKTHDYKVANIDGKSQLMSYHTYINFFGGENAAGYLLAVNKFEKNKVYSINIGQGTFLNQFPDVLEEASEFLYKNIKYSEEETVLVLSEYENLRSKCGEVVAGKTTVELYSDFCDEFGETECTQNNDKCYWDTDDINQCLPRGVLDT